LQVGASYVYHPRAFKLDAYCHPRVRNSRERIRQRPAHSKCKRRRVVHHSQFLFLFDARHTLIIKLDRTSKRPFLLSRAYFLHFENILTSIYMYVSQVHGDTGMGNGETPWFAI
jgi:hypothetical protein